MILDGNELLEIDRSSHKILWLTISQYQVLYGHSLKFNIFPAVLELFTAVCGYTCVKSNHVNSILIQRGLVLGSSMHFLEQFWAIKSPMRSQNSGWQFELSIGSRFQMVIPHWNISYMFISDWLHKTSRRTTNLRVTDQMTATLTRWWLRIHIIRLNFTGSLNKISPG